MTNDSLGRILSKATVRLKVLDVLAAERAWSDVVREAQEVVELALKALPTSFPPTSTPRSMPRGPVTTPGSSSRQ